MIKSSTNSKVDFYFNKPNKWQDAYKKLRDLALECGLIEELKWGVPCYTFNDNNIVLIHGFKDYCAILFHKGVLLQDAKGLLIEKLIKAYIYEAIEVEKAGLKVTLKKPAEFKMAEEFKIKLDEIPELKNAFESLTPGRQRGYLLHFAAAKQAKTRESRVEKWIPQILLGKGLED